MALKKAPQTGNNSQIQGFAIEPRELNFQMLASSQ
jgi:hypothetical protein